MGQSCTCINNLTMGEILPKYDMIGDGMPNSFIYQLEEGDDKINNHVFDSILNHLLEIDDGSDKPGDVHVPNQSDTIRQVRDLPIVFKGKFEDLTNIFGKFDSNSSKRPDNYRCMFSNWLEITLANAISNENDTPAVMPYKTKASVIDLKIIHISQFGEQGLSKMPLENQQDFSYQFYEGQWRREKFHGAGKLVTVEGHCYEGFFKQGLPHGPGRIFYTNGVKLSGIFKKGNLNGPAQLVGPFGETIKGEFKNNILQDTNVEEIHPSGAKYTGGYENGLKNGKGILILSNGDKIVANFVNNLIEGNGKLKIIPLT